MRMRQPWQTGVQSVCPRCKQQHVAEKIYSDTVEFRNLTLDVEGLQRYACSDCHFHWHTTEQTAHNQDVQRAAYQIERDRVRQRDGLLGSAEIAKAREALGLNQREAAQLFGGGFNAFNKYESGEVLQSQAMDRLLRLVVALGKALAVPMLEAISRGEPAVRYQTVALERNELQKYVITSLRYPNRMPVAAQQARTLQSGADVFHDPFEAYPLQTTRLYRHTMNEALHA